MTRIRLRSLRHEAIRGVQDDEGLLHSNGPTRWQKLHAPRKCYPQVVDLVRTCLVLGLPVPRMKWRRDHAYGGEISVVSKAEAVSGLGTSRRPEAFWPEASRPASSRNGFSRPETCRARTCC